MRHGNDPYKPYSMVSFEGIPRLIPSFPAEHQQGLGVGSLDTEPLWHAWRHTIQSKAEIP